MRCLSICGALFLAACQAPRPSIADQSREYLDAKIKYHWAVNDSAVPPDTTLVTSSQLAQRLRQMIGPLRVDGDTGVFSLDDPEGDGRGLDGLTFRSETLRGTIIATTPELLAGWLRSRWKDSSTDLGRALKADHRLTSVFPWVNAAVQPFADLHGKAELPPGMFMALVGSQSNEIAVDADQVIAGVRHGDLIFLVQAVAAAKIAAPESCGNPWTEVPYRRCFEEHIQNQPDFPKIVDQFREIGKFIAALPKAN